MTRQPTMKPLVTTVIDLNLGRDQANILEDTKPPPDHKEVVLKHISEEEKKAENTAGWSNNTG